MKNAVLLFIVMVMSGCLVRTYTVETPRVDLDINGNRGYLMGNTDEAAPDLKETRQTTVFEVELGSHSQRKKGNDYTTRRRRKKRLTSTETVEEETDFLSVESVGRRKSIYAREDDLYEEEEAGIDEEYTSYIVQKNDTLQKISKKFYGTTKKYLMLYEANKDVMKGLNKIYPGMEIKIPSAN